MCLIKRIFEVNNLTLQDQDTHQNQPHYGPLDHLRKLVRGFRMKSLLDIPSHTILFLKFPDSPIRFPLALEIPCSWKYIVIRNISPQDLVPINYDVIRNRLTWNHLSCVPSYKMSIIITHSLILSIQMFTRQDLHLRLSMSIMPLSFKFLGSLIWCIDGIFTQSFD